MLDYSSCLDGKEEILPFVRQMSTGGDDFVRFVGHERDGTLLYVWDAFPVAARIKRKVTLIGMFDGVLQTNTIVFHHERIVHIINCSINQDRSLIAFTVLEKVTIPSKDGKEARDENRYKTFTAEVQPQKGMYKLNIEGTEHIQLQFLYGKHRGFGENADKESHMIMLHHRESIGLYHFLMARVGEKGWIVCDQPRTENLMKKYLWCQWDPANQRLYILYSKKMSMARYEEGSGKAIRPEDTQIKPFMTCYQFGHPQVPYEAVLDVSIPFPLPKLRSSMRPSYYDCGPTLSTPEISINMSVLTMMNGTICVCFQHPLAEERSSRRRSSSSALSSEEDNPCTSLEYTVCMVHHAKSLVCCIPNVPRKLAEKARMSFSWTGDYLLVLLPGYIIHLLNVTSELEACHHIIVHDAPSGPFASITSDPSPYLTHYITERATIGSALFDPQNTLEVYKVSIDRDQMVKCFEQTKSFTQRLAILHYAILHARDITMVKKLFEIICNDPFNPDIKIFMQEFLVASTYGSVKRQLEKDLLRLFAFTTGETFRGNFEKNTEGRRIVTFNYLGLPVDLEKIQIACRDKSVRHADDMWDNLATLHTSKRLSPGGRFKNQEIHRQLTTTDPQKLKGEYKVSKNTPSLLKRLSERAKNKFTPKLSKRENYVRPPSRSELVLGHVPAFLSSSPTQDPDQDAIISIIVNLVGEHLRKFRLKDSDIKIHNLATEYIDCMQQQARQLCHIIWSVFSMEEKDVVLNVKAPTTEIEAELFHVYERLYLAAQEMTYPLPSGFLGYFACLAFRVLEFRMFVQYVNNHVISLTDEFVAKVILELEDTRQNVEKKCLLISKLPLEQALACHQIWNHPISRQFIARQMVRAKLSDGPSHFPVDLKPHTSKFKESGSMSSVMMKSTSSLSGSSSSGSDSPSGLEFPPLDTLMKTLEEADSRSKNKHWKKKEKQTELSSSDLKFIEESALLNAQQQGYRDFHVNF